jgi:DNA repair exonuclease SbcCD ATPase subunit
MERDRCARTFTEVKTQARSLHHMLEALPPAADLEAQATGAGWAGRPLVDLIDDATRLRQSAEVARIAGAESRATAEHLRTQAADLAGAGAKAHAEDARQQRLTADRQRIQRIRYAFGPRGMQGVLAESAGPAISDVANQLIVKAYGWPRWRVDIRTRRDNLKGDGQRDVAECTVYDAERDAEGLLENVSGGELDMLAAALAFGFAAHHGEVNGCRWEMLWLDEPTSAMTQEHRVRWIEMLRTAMPILGVKQALLVDQSEEVQRTAEAVVRVEELCVTTG